MFFGMSDIGGEFTISVCEFQVYISQEHWVLQLWCIGVTALGNRILQVNGDAPKRLHPL